jgi:putative transposase
MRRLDELYTAHPFLGYRKLTALLKAEGRAVNRKRVLRLLRLMGLQAVYCKPNTSRPHPAHPVHPYLLKGLAIIRPNQVWAADITYTLRKRSVGGKRPQTPRFAPPLGR